MILTRRIETSIREYSDQTAAVILRRVAKLAANQAQPRVSGFHVGAAGLTNWGRLVWGYNNETDKPHADSIHAEESMAARLLAGEKLSTVVVVGENGNLLTPCGNCREVLMTNSTEGGRFLLAAEMERSRWLSIRDTLPNPADARYPVRLPNREHAQHYLQSLFNAALSVLRDRAYTPYYPQFEATAILCNDGKLVAATPRQDASYQHERSVAVALAQIDATRSRIIEAVLFMFDGDSIDKPRFPDGRSRQMLFEAAQVAGNDFTVFAASTSGQIWLTTISELLPFAFGPADLGIDVSKYR